MLVKKSLKLLEELPVLRDAIFDYYSVIFEVSIGNYIKIQVSDLKIINRSVRAYHESYFVEKCV